MKQLYLLLVLFGLAIQALGQDYRPFRPGVLQQYAQVGSDTTYAVRLQRRKATGNATDSLYEFNWQVDRDANWSACLGYLPCYAETLFGSYLQCQNLGTRQVVYRFLDINQQPYFELRPYAPLNQSWGAAGAPITITARRLGTVLGRPDSIITIALSPGDTIRLSQHYGLLDSPSPYDWGQTWNQRRVRRLHLTALPERALGNALLGSLAIYDFQPGDVFCYEHSWSNMSSMGYIVGNSSYGDSILTRTASRTGDTLTYDIWRYRPAGRSGSRYQLTVFNQSEPLVSEPTGQYLPSQRACVRTIAPVPGRYNGRPVLRVDGHYSYCWSFTTGTDSLYVGPPPVDAEHFMAFAPGLGMLYSDEYNWAPNSDNTRLVGYRKGTEQWGSSCLHTMLLAASPARPLTTITAIPNPFQQELTVQFELSRAQAVALELRDALGRVVLARPATPQVAGSNTIQLATQLLPTGLYTLRLLPADGAARVLKVLKN